MKSILSLNKHSGSQAFTRHFALLLLALFSIAAKASTPTFTVVFSPDTIAPGQVSTMTYTINNSANASGVSGVGFTNTLPAGVTIAANPNAFTACTNGYYSAPASTDTVTFTDYRIGASSSCTFSVDVTSSTAGTHTNTTGDLSTSGGTVSGATDDLIVDNSGLGLSMAFAKSTISPEEVTTLTYTLDATSVGANLHTTGFTHSFTGIEVSEIPNVTTDCLSMAFAPTGGDTAISIASVSLNLGTTCSIQVDITGSTAGTFANNTNVGTYYEYGSNFPKTLQAASATISVELPFMYMNFPAASSPGASVSLTYNISNFERTDITGLSFTNDLNATLSGLEATALPASNFCGSGSTLSGSTSLSASNISLLSGESCSFSVTVLVPANAAPGDYTNTTSTINLTRDSATTSPAVSNTLAVQAAPSITSTVGSAVIIGGGDIVQTFTITNTDSANAVSGINFTQDIAGVIPATTISALPASNFCGTGSTASDNSTAILTIQDVNLAAGDSCTFSVTYTTPTDVVTGTHTFTTSTISGVISGNNVYTPPVSQSVSVIAAPQLSFSFDKQAIAPGDDLTASFSLHFGDNAPDDATNIAFTLDLDSVISGAAITSATQTDICGTGSSVTGTGVLTFAGGTLAAAASCTFDVTINIPNDAAISSHTFTTSAPTAISSGLNLTGSAVSSTVNVTGLTFTLSYAPNVTFDNSNIVATYTIANHASSPAATAIQFTQSYTSIVSSLQAVAPPATACNGASISGSTFLIFSGGSLDPGASCTFDITLAIPNNAILGTYVSVTSGLSATVSNNAVAVDAAYAELTITELTVLTSTTFDTTTSANPLPITIDFSRDVTGFDQGDLQISNGTVASFTANSAQSYSVNITPTSDGTVTIDVPASVANDAVFTGEVNPAANQLSFEYTSTAPVATPTLVISAPSLTDTTAGPVTYTVTYANAQQVNLTTAAISLNATGTSATVAVTNGDTDTPTVTLSNISGDGTLGFSIAADTARNEDETAAAYGPSTTFNVDNTAPTIAITDAVADINNATSFTATVTFSEAVTGFDVTDIDVTNAQLSNFATVSSSVYTVLVTPSADGDMTLDITASKAIDGVGNNNTAASQHTVTYDSVGPALTITGPVSDINSSETITFTFAEDVTGFAVGDIDVSNGAMSNFAATSPSVYTATLTPSADGLVTIDVAASVAIDTATNGNTVASQYSVKYDTTAPTLVVSATDTTVNVGFTAIFTFDEDVTGFDIADITVTNGSASNFVTTSASVYQADITPSTEGQVDVSVAASLAKDTATNFNTASNVLAVDYDLTAPTVAITSDKSAVNAPFTATFTFSEAVYNFISNDITVTNATVSNFSTQSTSLYTATITPANEGAVIVDVAAAVSVDIANNNNTASNQLSVTYDITDPTVTVSTDNADVNNDFTATFTFNEDVTGFELADISVSNGTPSNFVTTSAKIYQATITPSAEGAVNVSVAASLALDSAGNGNVASNDLIINYDITAPTVSISADATLSNTDFTLTFTFDEAVTDFTVNDLTSSNGSFSDFAATSSTVYTAKLQPSSDGNVAIDVPTNSAIDAAGNNNAASQTLNLTYDTTGPTLVVSGPTTAINSDFTATFTFDEAVTGFTNDDITVTNGTLSNFATTSSSEYTVSVSPDKNGDVTVSVAASLLTDTIGNANSASNIFTVEYDKQKPSVVVSGPTTPVNAAFDIEIDFSKNVNGFAQSMLTVTNGTVTAFDTQAQPKYKATITPSADGAVTVQIAADVVTDSPGNTNTASNLYTTSYDTAVPTIASFNPAHNDQIASAGNTLVITFNEAMVAGDSSNFVYLKDAADDSLVESIAASSSSVSISDTVATITLTNSTVETIEYYVEIDNLAFKDTAGNAFAGISGNSTWRFKVSNLPPVVVADIASVDEDASVLIDVLANDSDNNSTINPASLRIATQPNNGTTDINPATGIVTYTPTENVNGSDEFTYQVSDLLGKESVEGKVTINIKAMNDAPVANNDWINTDANVNVTIDVLANDIDVDSNSEIDTDSITITKAPQNGSAELIDGKIYYRPNSNYFGPESLEYAVQDIHQAVSNNGQVLINVIGTNIPPVASNDSYTTDEDTNVTLTPLDNDSDSDGQLDVTSVTLISQPTLGNITINADGSLTYVPQADKNGSDSFTYSVKDDQGLLATPATISIAINSINDAPHVADDTLVLINTTIAQTINVLSNDVEVDINDSISSIAIVTQPQFGTAAIDTATKLITYAPGVNFGSLDSFTYTATDSNNLTSTIATVTVSDTPINIPPVANNDTVQTDEDQFIAIDVLANDSDLNGRILPNSLVITAAPTNGSASVRRSDGQIYYTPNSNFSGEDQLTYQIEDNRGDSDTAIVTITINSVNDTPTATPLSLSTDEDNAVTMTLAGSDIDGDTITYSIETTPANGTLSGAIPNLTYTPDQDFAGVDSFYYVVNDGKVDSNLTTVTINVNGQNDAPTASGQVVTLNEDTSRSIILIGNDIDGDTLTYRVTNQPSNGALTGDGNSLVYAGNLNYHGSDSFTFVTNDGTVDSAPAAVDISVIPVNDAPIALIQSFELNEDESIEIQLIATDEDNDPLTFTITQNPTYGVLEGTAPFLTYRPNANFNGNDNFSFTANDGSASSQSASINLSVISVNDAPDAQDIAVSTSEDLPLSISLNGSDPDNDRLTLADRSEPANGSISGNGLTVTYTPNENFNGTDSFTYQLTDDSETSRIATVSITIDAINDAPEAVTDQIEQDGTAPITIDVIANDTDADGDDITLTEVTPSIGTASIVANQLLYTPDANFVGQTKVFYTIQDSQGATAQGQVNIKIKRINNNGNAIVNVPNDIYLNATGVLTTVDLGVATAFDIDGTPLPVTLLSDQNHFKSGVNTVYWQATDSQGNLSIANQTVTIEPQIAIDPYQIVQEGHTATVKVRLNGPAVQYPMVIPYTISGSAQLGDDHNIQNGELIINSGLQAQLDIALHQDQQTEGDETLIITLAPSLNVAAQHQHQLIISEQLQAPKLNLSAKQNDTQAMVVNRQDGLITIDLSADQPLNTFNFSWQTQPAIENLSDSQSDKFVFDPQLLEPGSYRFTVNSQNKSAFNIVSEASLTVLVQQSAAQLGIEDSDQDGISDQLEGHQDSDKDGIADYLDAINNCNVLATNANNINSHLIESQAGSCLRLGTDALTAQQQSATINGITNVLVTDLAQAGLSYQIVIAEHQPLPENAIVQLNLNQQWYDFSEDADNYLMSAQGENGVCPAPASNQWQMGLQAGHWCVQLTIKDGDINDADNAINREIAITSKVVSLSDNALPSLSDDNSETRQGLSTIIDVLANDIDADGDSLTLTRASALFGQVSIVDNQIHYQPLSDHLGTDTINYLATDNQSGAQSATLTVTISANNLPVALDDHANAQAGQTITIDVLNNDTDADGDTLTLLGVTGGNGSISIVNNKINYQSASNFSGNDVINYSVGDGYGGQTVGTLIVSVTVAASDNNQPQPVITPSGGGSTHPLWLMLLGLLFIARQQKRTLTA